MNIIWNIGIILWQLHWSSPYFFHRCLYISVNKSKALIIGKGLISTWQTKFRIIIKHDFPVERWKNKIVQNSIYTQLLFHLRAGVFLVDLLKFFCIMNCIFFRCFTNYKTSSFFSYIKSIWWALVEFKRQTELVVRILLDAQRVHPQQLQLLLALQTFLHHRVIPAI